jgi:hypothetical protein
MGCEPLKLLSWKLTIKHPLHGNPVTFSAPTPIWIGLTRLSEQAFISPEFSIWPDAASRRSFLHFKRQYEL